MIGSKLAVMAAASVEGGSLTSYANKIATQRMEGLLCRVVVVLPIPSKMKYRHLLTFPTFSKIVSRYLNNS